METLYAGNVHPKNRSLSVGGYPSVQRHGLVEDLEIGEPENQKLVLVNPRESPEDVPQPDGVTRTTKTAQLIVRNFREFKSKNKVLTYALVHHFCGVARNFLDDATETLKYLGLEKNSPTELLFSILAQLIYGLIRTDGLRLPPADVNHDKIAGEFCQRLFDPKLFKPESFDTLVSFSEEIFSYIWETVEKHPVIIIEGIEVFQVQDQNTAASVLGAILEGVITTESKFVVLSKTHVQWATDVFDIGVADEGQVKKLIEPADVYPYLSGDTAVKYAREHAGAIFLPQAARGESSQAAQS